MFGRQRPKLRDAARLSKPMFVAAAAAILAACGTAQPANPPASTVERAPVVDTVPTPTNPEPPGTVINETEIQPPTGARAWRVDYHSTGVTGSPVGERMLLVVPMREPPPGGFPLVVWGHPTKGSADSCAPSYEGAASILLIEPLIREGYAVAAPDYEGLAAAGPHPYLVGTSEGRSMLDAARAARQVKGSGVRDTSPVLLWGFSQGGHAALFAAQIQPEWAPELDVRGVAVAAPVSNVEHFVRRAEGWPAQFGVLVTVVYGYANAYPELDPAAILTPSALADIDDLEDECIVEVTELYDRPVAEMLLRSPREEPAFVRRFAENLAGTRKLGVPALVIQGAVDDIVDPADTTALVNRMCANGDRVVYVLRPGENHAVTVEDLLLPWLRARVAGEPSPAICGTR
ncbi:MAG: lipase family protein [Acidimicrobiales bacterium]|nr:lipase family protein [Acidimicrobiales bacterium]